MEVTQPRGNITSRNRTPELHLWLSWSKINQELEDTSRQDQKTKAWDQQLLMEKTSLSNEVQHQEETSSPQSISSPHLTSSESQCSERSQTQPAEAPRSRKKHVKRPQTRSKKELDLYSHQGSMQTPEWSKGHGGDQHWGKGWTQIYLWGRKIWSWCEELEKTYPVHPPCQ